jgi:iron complex outermembrane recepter protein
MTSRLFTSTCLLALSCVANPALAQQQGNDSAAPLETTVPPTNEPGEGAPDQERTAASATSQSASTEEGGLSVITVTAQRREEDLQRAAVAVSAVTGDSLVQQSITEATQLTRLVPALQVAPAAGATQIYLRGVGTFGANAFAEQGVAFNLDGVYLDRPAAPAGLFYDLERIEVLKGPQGTLYGRNASGGAVNVITAKPKFGDVSGFLTGEYGNYNTFKTQGAINLPLGDQMAVRIAAQHAEHDGYFNDGYDDEDTQAVRGQIRAEFGPVELNLSADYAHVGGKGIGGTIMPLLFDEDDERLGVSDPQVLAAYLSRSPTAPVPQTVARSDGYQDNDFFGLIGTMNVDLGFATLTVIPAYRTTDIDTISYASSFLIDVVESSKQSSVEARLANEGDRLTWVLGAYYLDLSINADQLYDQGNNSTRINSDLDTNSYAVFGQATYSLTDTFRVTGGLRYTLDQKQQLTNQVARPFVGFVPPGPPAFTPIFATIPSTAVTDIEFERVTWKAGVEYDAAPRSLLYASVATGFKSGILYSAVGQNYSEPEALTAYTIGSKNRFLDNRLQANLELFYWDYKDQQISGLGPVQVATTPGGPIFGPVFLTQNAGSATIYGAEFELLFQPTRNDLFSANLQYLKTNYDDLRFQAFSSSGIAPASGCVVTPTAAVTITPIARVFNIDCTGKPLPNSPELALNLGYEHTFDLGASGRIIAGADTRIETERFLSIDYVPLASQGGHMMSNARITYETDNGLFSLTGFINNIENELVFSNTIQSPVKVGVFYNQIRPPRTYGIRAAVKF